MKPVDMSLDLGEDRRMAELSVWVSGKPRPKGSLDLMANDRAKENNPASTPWRKHMARELRSRTLSSSWPITAPVAVRLRFLFARPAEPAWPLPATTATGDVDKLTRNVLDALTDAGVIKDDALVCDLDVTARYAPANGRAGALIEVREIDLAEGL